MALTEVVCMMVVGAILAAICFPLIGRLFVARSNVRNEIGWQASLHALSMQLRSDIESIQARPTVSDNTVTIPLEGTSNENALITYRFDKGVIERIISDKNGAVSAQEHFVFGKSSNVEFNMADDMLRLNLEQPSFRFRDQANRTICIHAMIKPSRSDSE